MARHRYRTNKVKRMHGIIDGLLPILEAMAAHPAIDQITPGRIATRRSGASLLITAQYFTNSGLKLLARSPSSVQEVFVVTSRPVEVQAWLITQKLIQNPHSEPGSENSKTQSSKASHNSTRRASQRGRGIEASQPKVSNMTTRRLAEAIKPENALNEASPLEAWLAQTDDRTFQHLATQFKGQEE